MNPTGSPIPPIESSNRSRRHSGLTLTGGDRRRDSRGGVRGEVREYGRIWNTLAALERLTSKRGRDGVRLRFCCEARLCGYGIQSHLWGEVDPVCATAGAAS